MAALFGPPPGFRTATRNTEGIKITGDLAFRTVSVITPERPINYRDLCVPISLLCLWSFFPCCLWRACIAIAIADQICIFPLRHVYVSCMNHERIKNARASFGKRAGGGLV